MSEDKQPKTRIADDYQAIAAEMKKLRVKADLNEIVSLPLWFCRACTAEFALQGKPTRCPSCRSDDISIAPTL